MATFTLLPGQTSYTSTLIPNFAVGETANSINGNSLNNIITGNQYDDFIFGLDGNDFLNGAGGNDVLSGGMGNDTLLGGAGNDALYGNTGTNIMFGGTGDDTFFGGDGDDTFIFAEDGGAGGFDVISASFGADPGNDRLQLNDIASTDALFYNFGGDLYITSTTDVADGFFNSGVIIEDWYSTPGLGLVDEILFSDSVLSIV